MSNKLLTDHGASPQVTTREPSLQFDLPLLDANSLQAEMTERIGHRFFHGVQVIVTNNSSSIMNSQAKKQKCTLRLHLMFLRASPEVLKALATWLMTQNSCPEATDVLDTFIRGHRYLIVRTKQQNDRTKGDYHDLQEIYDELNKELFQELIDAPIIWGRIPSNHGRRRRNIRMGSYTPEDHLIRIHPYLDQHFVPRYFVRYIVFHEMLHAHLGCQEGPTGRLRVHTPEFRHLERAYPGYKEAVAWHHKNLWRLLAPQ